MKLTRTLAQLGLVALLGASAAHADTIFVANDITGTETWYSTNTYMLQTVVYVHSNAVLNIEPGTVIKGSTANLIPREGIPNLVSALWVTRGGKLFATGTVDKPIVFTSEQDPLNGMPLVGTITNVPSPGVTNILNAPLSGLWGGVTILGQGRINSAQYAAGNSATNAFKYERYEGTTSETNQWHFFGGTNDGDSSGILRYVSIRYPGSVFAPARELNGLTMGAVGSGTTIEYVEVLGSSDDAFEWWGGSVNTRYLVAAFCEDDDFDTDQGYRGTNQFWFGIKPPWAGSSDSRGFETDGDLAQGAPNEPPISQWLAHNVTLIGRGSANEGFGGGYGWNTRDEAAPSLVNSIVTEFAYGMLMDFDGVYHFTNTPVLAGLSNTIFGVSAFSNPTNTTGDFLFTQASRTNTVQDPLLLGIGYTNDVPALNPRPATNSPALANVLAGAPMPVNYRGAFGQNDNWADGWTFLSAGGYLVPGMAKPNAPVLQITQSGPNVQITYASQSGFSYQLQSATNLNSAIFWANEGGAQTGTGGTLTNTAPATGSQQFFRVLSQ